LDTARLLDNFEQRFAELKGRKASARVLGDLYSLGTQLEQRGRGVQATAVYRHLARIDATYRDVNLRLGRLMDAERVKPKSAPPAGPSPSVPTPQRSSAESATQSSPMSAPAAAKAAADKVAPSKAPAAPVPAPGARDIAAAADAGSAGAVVDVGDVQRLGRYQLEREIGRGAMGVVYLGRDTAINRLVAIKAIPLASEFSESELADARSRFFREAETAGRLNHPNIVTIYDVGEERGLAYIAMEYLKGRHLSDYASSDALLEPRKVLELIGRTAQALGFAHKQQVVHRDIKPANIMYDPNADVLKITDFGIARLTGTGTTRTGIVLGTPSFMSPEQLEGRTVTGHSDLFSLGVSLFQLLTGHLPFTADSMTGLMQQIAEAPHPPLRAFRPDLPACVESIIDRALAKNPEARFESGAQMAAALDDCRSRLPTGLP
jgi:serine/threonine-protein kinase